MTKVDQDQSKGLTPRQREQFERDGFLLVRQLLGPEALQPLIDELALKVEQGVEAAVEQGLLAADQTYTDASFERRLALVSKACAEPGWIWEQFFRAQKPRSAGMFALRTAPALLDVVESLIGPEVLAHPQYNFRAKMPDQELTVIPWHQDLAYLNPEEAGETLVVNAWIPLVDATAENGCMQVIRGSHKLEMIVHDYKIDTVGHTGRKGIREADLPPGEVVTAACQVGDVFLTTERLVHRGTANRSQTVRWSVDSRYCQIGLPNGRPNVPGFVARSQVDRATVVKDWQAWDRLFAD